MAALLLFIIILGRQNQSNNKVRDGSIIIIHRHPWLSKQI